MNQLHYYDYYMLITIYLYGNLNFVSLAQCTFFGLELEKQLPNKLTHPDKMRFLPFGGLLENCILISECQYNWNPSMAAVDFDRNFDFSGRMLWFLHSCPQANQFFLLSSDISLVLHRFLNHSKISNKPKNLHETTRNRNPKKKQPLDLIWIIHSS